MSAVVWVTDPCGHETTELGRYRVLVWTGSLAIDLDDGHQVCSVYIPTTDRQLPNGLELVGRRRLDTRDRAAARAQALDIAREAIADYQARS